MEMDDRKNLTARNRTPPPLQGVFGTLPKQLYNDENCSNMHNMHEVPVMFYLSFFYHCYFIYLILMHQVPLAVAVILSGLRRIHTVCSKEPRGARG